MQSQRPRRSALTVVQHLHRLGRAGLLLQLGQAGPAGEDGYEVSYGYEICRLGLVVVVEVYLTSHHKQAISPPLIHVDDRRNEREGGTEVWREEG